jgi:putative nucleotidyltransferase with HDIG domain
MEEALQLIKQNVENDKLVKHMLAVGAIMKETAKFLGKNEEKWELVGLLHDIDFEITKEDQSLHGIRAEEILKGKVDEEILRAIKAHNFEFTNVLPETEMEYALIAADQLSGLIVATALVMPSKKLEEVRVESVINSFKDKSFARRCSREKILYCEKIGIKRDKFFEIALNALKNISDKLGL